MQNNDWMKAGEDILHSVLDAVEQQDFSGLSKNIENTVNNALGYVGEKLTESSRRYSNAQNDNAQSHRTGSNAAQSSATQEWINTKREKERALQEQRERETKQFQLYKKNPPGTYSGVVFQVLGIIGTTLFGLSTSVLTILALMTGLLGMWLADIMVSGMLAGSIIMLYCGVKMKGRVSRFWKYVKRIGDKQFCRIEELAQAAGKSIRFVERDLRGMISDRFFLEGHLDQGATTLITSDEMYDQYLESEKAREIRELEAQKQAGIQARNSVYPEEVRQILEEGNRYIQHIHACNDAIPGEVMSQKLETLENIMKRIFEQLKKSPESCDDLQKLMKYYLPTTSKLLDAYIELDAQPAYGSKNIETTKKEIEDTLDVINAAFGRLFDDMFEETAWDISADISTMKTMLAKEGLTGERDFQ